MQSEDLLSTIKSFADKPDNVKYEGGAITGEVHDEIFEVLLKKERGILYCVEDGKEYTAWEWVTERLGRFELLARRILDYIPKDDLIIPVEAEVLNVLDKDPEEKRVHTEDAMYSVKNLLDDPLDVTKVVYLTSDAGEGKTSIIDQLTRVQAELYLEGETDWLMLPVKLGGRPFIRLDDVIIGTLSNRLRFPYYFYESVIELVKQDALVPALDGFEEVFFEAKAGDAVSSLGNLVNELDSSGNLLVAARTAYYEYRDFESQAKLFQSIRESDVSFAEVGLRRWSKDQFVLLAEKMGIEEEGEDLFETIASRLNEDHALLTRAVLARRLIEEYAKTDDREALIEEFSQATGEEYFDQFVSRIVRREANEVWIDRSGDPARPLLSVEEHHTILSSVAEEMWRSGVNSIKGETLEDLTSLVVSEELDGSPEVVRQSKERITTHALLIHTPGTNLYKFDHEEFKNYYLGRYTANLVRQRRLTSIKSFMGIKVLPDMAKRTCVTIIRRELSDSNSIIKIVERLCKVSESGQKASFVSANMGKIVLGLLEGLDVSTNVLVEGIYDGSSELWNSTVENVTFKDSTFERAGISHKSHKNIKFEDSDIYHLIVEGRGEYENVKIGSSSIPSKLTILEGEGRESRFYEPNTIESIIGKMGLEGDGYQEGELKDEVEKVDLEVKIVDRVIRYYQRSTAITENVFKKRLGTWWNKFEEEVLPDLLRYGVLEEVTYSGAGEQRRFRLSDSFEQVEDARRKSKGDYGRLIDFLKE